MDNSQQQESSQIKISSCPDPSLVFCTFDNDTPSCTIFEFILDIPLFSYSPPPSGQAPETSNC